MPGHLPVTVRSNKMRFVVAVLIIAIAAASIAAQAPTLRIVTEDPNLPSELFYGDVKVKPLRLRPGTNTPITINDSDFFVHQQYVDFLSRLADPNGFNFWLGNITACGTDPNCIAAMRVNVSAAFYLSIEFQQSGYLVYRAHLAAFGDLPGAPVPVRRETFTPESRSIGKDVLVGTQGWELRLENNKVAYFLAFVQRPAFQTAYPNTMTATEFVNKVDANAGNVLSSSEKSQIIAGLTSPSDFALRAAALRAVAENANLHQREFNEAFVLMQYFGYLKRNPNDAPDTNFGGYNFWLGKLNQFNGNFIQAEMVKAFISSIEYGQRF